MSQFSRRAKWLNILFPASVAPQVVGPDRVSEDVSLVQQYDGGGYNFNDVQQTFYTAQTSPPGASGEVTILTVPDDQIFRLMAAHTFNIVGSGGAMFSGIFLESPTGSSRAAYIDRGNPPVVSQGALAFRVGNVVAGPGVLIRGNFSNGQASDVAQYNIYGFLAPLGTVFHC